MSAPLSQVLTTARTYLNDDAGQVFPDPVLIPKVQEAHRELQENLWIVGSPLVRGQSLLAYTTPGTAFPTLPTDFLCPTALFENAASSAVSAAGWVPMTEAFYIPLGTAVAATLGWWAWQQEQIVIAGASANRAVILQYRRSITVPVLSTDLIGILFGESYLAARAAAIAAGTLGNADLYTNMTALAKENLGRVISANRGQQKSIIKP
jgi:hypothetical protein